MLFHIKQSHAPADCPYGKGGSRSLFDADHPFLKPGAGVTVCEVTPVSDAPVATS
ncbi:MAG: hypothetical protein JOZ82_08200 [Marmoricola sp.]|nr:hypothetical protein [Marmoricola sp.]